MLRRKKRQQRIEKRNQLEISEEKENIVVKTEEKDVEPLKEEIVMKESGKIEEYHAPVITRTKSPGRPPKRKQ